MIHTETVHPSQLRRAMASYANQGYPPAYGPHPFQAGMMVIVITLPDDADIPDWRYTPPPSPRRRRSWRIDGRQVLAWLCVLVIVGGLGYLGYTMATGGALPTWEGIAANMPAMPDQIAQMFEPAPPRGEPVVEETGWHWPWESSVISKPQAKEGFRWPWQDAQDAASEVVESAKMAGLMIAGLFLVLGGLWIVGIVRGALGK